MTLLVTVLGELVNTLRAEEYHGSYPFSFWNAMEPSRPMVGREVELESLKDILAKAHHGHGTLVMVAGEAGSGRTALCEAFERMAAQGGCSILVGRCIPGNQAPYIPFLEAWFGRSPNPFIGGEGTLEGGDQVGEERRI